MVRGDQQDRCSLDDTYAATLAGKSFKTLIDIVTRFDLELVQYDAVNAFVHTFLDDEVYIRMPPGYKKRHKLLRLLKAMYGLPKCPLLWQKDLKSTLESLGFVMISYEVCCFMKDGILFFFYVDDIVLGFNRSKRQQADEVVAELKKKYNLSGGEDLKWFLGIEVIRDREGRYTWLSQASYIDKISRLAETSPYCPTPMSTTELLPYEGQADPYETKRYQRKVGSLLYAATTTRPDIAFATLHLARFMSNPSPEHHRAADRALCYLAKTRSLALQFGNGNRLDIASDSSFADNTRDRKSSQGFVIQLFGGTIAWRASKQDTVSTSTTEAELLALSQTAKESLYISRLIRELSVTLDDDRIRIQCDNHQTIRCVTAEVAVLNTRLRHMDIQNHWLRQEVSQKRIEVVYMKSAENMADGLTKALQQQAFRDFTESIGLVDIRDSLTEKVIKPILLSEYQDLLDSYSPLEF